MTSVAVNSKLKSIIQNISKADNFDFIVISSVFIYLLIIGLQGFDMCDEGWVLTTYQEIFKAPGSVEYMFLYYTSALIGGIWNLLFGWMGYWGFRLLSCITITATYYFIYLILKDYFNKKILLIAIFLCILVNNNGLMVFHHNYLTSFFIALSCYLFFNGIKKESNLLVLFSGMILGINIFARLPNLSMCTLILALIPYFCKSKNTTQTLKFIMYAICGFCCGIGLILLLLLILGHWKYLINAFSLMQQAATDNSSTHDIFYLFKVYASNYFTLTKIVCITSIVPVIYMLSNQQSIINHKLFKALFTFIAVFGAILIAYKYSSLYILYGISTLIIILTLIYIENIEIKTICILAFIWMHVLPIGSDFGIENMGAFSFILAIPLSLGVIERYLKTSRKKLPILKGYIWVLLWTIIVIDIYNVSNNCYFDSGSRYEKKYLINNPKANTFTTKRNCDLLNPLLSELNKYVKKGDVLLQYMKCPTIHYLTETKPYIGNSWIWSYTPTAIREQLKKAYERNKKLPVVVREKSAIGTWYIYDPTWNNDMAPETYEHKNEKITIINDFLTKHRYKLVWENEVFQILIPYS